MVSIEVKTCSEPGDSHQQADSTGIVLGGVLQDSQERTGRGRDNVVDVTGDEEQHDEEDSSSDGTDTDTGNHNLRALHRGVGDFLNHMGDAILDSVRFSVE